MNRSIPVIASACAVLIALSGCSAAGTQNTETEPIISTAITDPQNPLVPGNTAEPSGGRVVDELFAGLVSYDPDGTTRNEIASSITSNEDATEFTITLEDGWTFTDGTPVTASSFADAWNYTANAANGQLNASFFDSIEGYEELQRDDVSADETMSGLTVVDDLTLRVTMSKPDSAFPNKLGVNAYYPLPQSFYDDPEAFGQNPVGNGPYKLEEWDHGTSITIVKNEDYHGNRTVRNGGIEFRIYTDTEAAYADAQAGNIDLLDSIPNSALDTFQNEENLNAYSQPGSGISMFSIPATAEHFGWDEEGRLRRQAISMAIDRDAINEKIYDGRVTPATDFTSPRIPGYSDELEGSDVLDYNPDKARELWEQANAISEWSGEFTLTYNADAGNKIWVDAVCNSIKNVLGIEASGNPIATFSELLQEVSDRAITTAFRRAWTPDYPSMENYLARQYASSAADGLGRNDVDYKNAEFDALIDQAASAGSEEEAQALYQRSEEILLRDLPAIPLWYGNVSGVYAKDVDNVEIDFKNIPVYEAITK
ncbi:peptide ABC transporter substrate-binding protein [Bifidobacterium eulemuris]|nr:ABC transporter substrate-binding protein [Bifidobacterium eulemuris]